jgi:dCTP deaminase
MPHEPWHEWIPGVLSKTQMSLLINEGFIEGAREAAVDYSSLDLMLANEAYELVGGCVKPFGGRYLSFLKRENLVRSMQPSADGTYKLHARRSYLFRINERIGNLRDSQIFGQATAKSSVGRMDVLARLIVDGMDEYEGFDPRKIACDMFLEVTPMTFNVVVKPDTALTQLRLFKGAPIESRMRGESLVKTVLHGDEVNDDATLSVDLSPTRISGIDVSAFCATLKVDDDFAIEMWKQDEGAKPKPWAHWTFQVADENSRLRIRKDNFYIIRSYEKIWLPPGVAVYCRASDETIGEMRIHYAGFAHPFFGGERTDSQRGTPLIFEVRGHDVDVSLRHREKMARLEFYRMSEDSEKAPGRQDDPYAAQTLKLSTYFGRWPERATRSDAGVVTPEG